MMLTFRKVSQEAEIIFKLLDHSIIVIIALTTITNYFIPIISAIDPNCDYYHQLKAEDTFYLFNKECPSNYQGAVSCRWIFESPTETQISLDCDYISLPPATDCATDRLTISVSGENNLRDGHNYCGDGPLRLESNYNKLSVGLFSVEDSNGGHVSCVVSSFNRNSPNDTTDPPPVCDCGLRNSRLIAGGVDAIPHEFPFMVAIYEDGADIPYCGGSVISERYVLSAAHTYFAKHASDIRVMTGQHTTEINNMTPDIKQYEVEHIFSHPQFDTDTFAYDVAILRTTKSMNFGRYVSPVCLPFKYSDMTFVGESVTVIGWGTLTFTGPRPKVLQKATLKVISNEECKNEKPENETIVPTSLCTFMPLDKDACQFDSGGPLLWHNPENNRLYVTATVSYGIGCASENPSVNNRVTTILDWIKSVTPDAFYCVA